MVPLGGILACGTMLLVAGTTYAQGVETGSLEDDWRALIALYNATNGNDWTTNDNWSTSTSEVPTDYEINEWHGVTVESERVVRLELRDNNLRGGLPEDLGSLTALRYLDLQENGLFSRVPATVGELASLEELHLDLNSLYGRIPAELGKLSRLERLSLGSNDFSGTIPDELGNLRSLTHLSLGSNGLRGQIPSSLGQATNLVFLVLGINNLSGPIPAELGSLNRLAVLSLQLNRLSGSLPAELAGLKNLHTLILAQNSLQGRIPAWIGDLKNLNYLALDRNRFSGRVPDELGDLAKLGWLDIRANLLVGELPADLTRIPELKRFFWGEQELCAPITASFQAWLDRIQYTSGSNCAPESGIIAEPAVLSVLEGDPVGSAFNVRLARRPLSDVTVAISGHEGTDVRLSTDTLTVAPGSWYVDQPVTVTAVRDADAEDDEERLVLAASGGGFGGLSDTVVVKVLDESTAAMLQVADARVSERVGWAVFRVTLSQRRTSEVTVDYATLDGTATANEDYLMASGVLQIPPGELSGEIRVFVIDDALTEPDEDFTLRLSNPQGAWLADRTAEGLILDDDTYQLSVNDVAVSEAVGEAVFAISLDRANPVQTVSVQYATADGTAISGEDYEARAGTLSFTPGVTSQTVGVPILDDDLREPSEDFSLVLSGAQNAEIARQEGLATIVDNDGESLLGIDDVVVGESTGSAVFSVTLSGQNPLEVTVDFATEDQTASAGVDYSARRGTLRFESGEAVKEIVVPILPDDLDEPDEAFLVKLVRPTRAGIEKGTGRATITDDDELPTISIRDGRAKEDAGVIQLPVQLSRASSRAVSMQFATSDGTAEAGLDYTSSRGFVIFESGSTEGVVAIRLQDDALDEEAGETFRVTLSHPINATISRGVATGTIVDNDGVPLLRVGDITVSEASGEAVFVATLSVPSAVPVTAAYRTVDGTAQAGLDYEMAAGTLAFAPGVVQERIVVRLIRDAQDWRAETFSVALLSVSNARLEDAEAEATIVEEEPVEEGVLAAHLARFARTAASHVVEAIGERLRWQELEPSCASVPADAMGMMRYANPNWDPSAGELLSGCGLVATSGALGVWGRGAFTRQSGKEDALSLNADVATGAMGVDYSWKGRLMAGLLFSHSQASGTYEAYSAEGETRSGLTGAYPYVSYRLRSGTLWAAAGLGRGQSEVLGEEKVEADLGSSLWAAGAVGTLASGQWAQLLYQADAFVTRAEAEGRAEVVVSRVRAGLEGSMVLASPLQPYLEAALRHDGGDAETGLGLELGSGVRLARPGSRLRAELRSRGLVMHADGTLSEWGVAAALRYGAQRGLGPSAEVRPIWGPAQSRGLHALWRHDTVADATGGLPGRRRVEVKFGYGMRLKKERNVARPVLAVVLRGKGRDYRLGYEVQLDNGLAFSASAAAYETDPWRPVRYGLTTGAALRW